LPLEQLEKSLQQVIRLADDKNNNNIKLGWLTSSNRDDWAEARAQLLRVGGLEMEQALQKLESGALLLCLDDDSPVSRKQCGELFLHGHAGSNRWFDKSVQLFCTNNGKAGLQGEHAMMDGMPVVGLANHITNTSYSNAKERSKLLNSSEYSGSNRVENIFGNLSAKLEQSEAVQQAVDKARNDFVKLVSDHELDVQSFQAYGSNFIKQAGFSPDAYVQMAMQVATYRLFGEQVGTYEATQMRPFLHGRTETTRTVSTASHAFCETMGPRPKRDEHEETMRTKKLALLRDAADAHVEYIGKAAKGEGVDRHFFGLQMVNDGQEQAPALFTDPVFQRSKRWRVSTSHLTHPKFENWGYGEVVPDGVGLAYAIKADCCIFNITALKEHQWTDRLSHLLEEALLEMRDLVEADTPPRSKL
jgi:carnitine O-acetyltransferase